MSLERLIDRVLLRGKGKNKYFDILNGSKYHNNYNDSYAFPSENSDGTPQNDLPQFIKDDVEEPLKNDEASSYDFSRTSSSGGKFDNNSLNPQKQNQEKSSFMEFNRSIIKDRPWYVRFSLYGLYWSFILTIWVGLFLVIAVTVYALISPDPLKAGLKNKPANLSIVASNGKVIAEKGLRRDHVKLEEMPKHVINAVLATEDRRFYYHPGLDPIGIIRASIANRRAGRIVQGGSTITQQLAKVLFLKPARNYWRKIEEMLLAFWLEYRFSKKQILELYLNRIYFGAGNYGIEAASQHYYGKSVSNISVYEAAILAGLIKSPSFYAPTRNFKRSLSRGKVVLQNMRNAWMLSWENHQKALNNIPTLRTNKPSESYGYVIDLAVERVSSYGQNLQHDMIVETTIDYDLQAQVQNFVNLNMSDQGKKFNASQAAAVILDRNGAIKALVGGRNYKKNQFNRAVKSRRQPGSTFKPFVFLAAMEKGLTPDSEVYDGPLQIGDWSPENYSKRYFGDVSLRVALAKSLNTVSVRLSEWVGRQRVIQTAHRLGISTKLQNNPSIALGTSGVSLLELTAAYAPFSNGGYAVRPHIIKLIRDKNNNLLYKQDTKNWGQVVKAHFVAAMNDMLTATVVSGTAKKANIPPHQVAGKTGTGQGYRDAWFVGYTSHYIGGVWIGNDDFKPMKKATGGSLPALIWRDMMLHAHLQKEPQSLPGGNWQQQANWAEPRRRERRGSFFDSLFGGFSSEPDDTSLGTRDPRRDRRQRERIDRAEWEEIFGG